MFSTRKTITIVALAAAGVLSVGAVASAQATSGQGSTPTVSSDSSRIVDRTPVTATPLGDDNGLRGDGTVDDDAATAVTAPTTPAPVPSTGLPTDADHPQGDDSIGRANGDDCDTVGEDDNDDSNSDDSNTGVSDDGAHQDAAHQDAAHHGAARQDDAAHHDAGHDNNDDSGHRGSRR